MTANQFTRENYDFVGWSTNASATEADLEDGANGSDLTTTNNGTVTLYAVWKLSVTTIVFHDQGGIGGPEEVVWLIGSVQHPISPKRQGYNFAGWTTNEDGTGSIWPTTDIVPVNIHDYYAQWIRNMYSAVQQPNIK